MRKTINYQLTFGETEISRVKFNVKSRDDIPQLLKGLQFIYTQIEVKEKIFRILENEISPNIDKRSGRPGMNLWKILVMGTLRLNLNWDYDRLHEMVNNHKTIRQILGHGLIDEGSTYHLQTLKDNIKLLNYKVLDEINKVVVDCGHKLVKKKDNLKGRCDSFVVETDVHFPTDISLLLDSTRKVINSTATICKRLGILGWRQSKQNIKQLKRQAFKLQKMKHSTSKNPYKVQEKKQQIADAYKEYTKTSKSFIEKAKSTQREITHDGISENLLIEIDRIYYFIGHAERQIDQIIRRIVKEETIPHQEKVFSVFETHTEWICKGKAKVDVELGLNVAILEDEFGFILNHQVMQNQTDKQIAVPFVKKTKWKFPQLSSCSFDKGFHSKINQEELKQILDIAALPKKGKLSKKDKEYQQSEKFINANKKHSSVESAINALEVHGLDRCPDNGIYGFKRYVSLAVLSRNIQVVGSILIKREKRLLKRKKKLERKNREKYQLAA